MSKRERQLESELEVHKLELEAQNAELLASQMALEAVLARYTELFDFAPLGYAVIGPEDVIREINHAGAKVLLKDRALLAGVHLSALVTPRDRSIFAAM